MSLMVKLMGMLEKCMITLDLSYYPQRELAFHCGVSTQRVYTTSSRLSIYRSKNTRTPQTQKVTWLQKSILLTSIGFLLVLKSQVRTQALPLTET